MKRGKHVRLVTTLSLVVLILGSLLGIIGAARADSSGGTSYEAEAAANTLGGGAYADACSGCSGGEDVRFVGNGGTLTFNNINVSSAGTYDVTIYYLNNDPSRAALMSVNDGSSVTLTFPSSGDWNTVATQDVSVSLNAGNNTIEFSNPNGWTPNFDRIVVSGGSGGSTPTPIPTSTPTTGSTKYEAELAALSNGAKVANDHSGYSGTGYVDGYWYAHATTTFTVTVPASGTYNVDLRYANAKGATMTISLYVNGSKLKQIALPTLADWNSWSDEIETVSLNAGNNTLAYVYDTGDSGNVNLDYIIVSGGSGGTTPTPTPTPTSTPTATPTSTPTPTPTSTPTSGWTDRLLNSDGSINWDQYNSIANNYNQPDVMDYRFGPTYSVFHPTPENIPTIAQSGTNGWYPQEYNETPPSWSDWYAESGNLLYAPDSASDPGIARARNGSLYCTATYTSIFDYRISWTPNSANYYSANPDPSVTQQSWIDTSGGHLPNPPVAVARSRYMPSTAGVSIFSNGLVGVTPNGNDVNTVELHEDPYVMLDPGKVPTAIALTLNHQFALVTVWDTVNHKGQLAVIAIEGNLLATGANRNNYWYWGLPNWQPIRTMKLLGYVDLPFAAPTAVESSDDISFSNGRAASDNANADLSQQSQRDVWYNGTGSEYQKTTQAGYAMVSSRAENKVAFVDLTPLYQYYRTMYFTSQDNYNATQQVGTAPNQWPYTFSVAPQQQPTVVSTISITQPTALAVGFLRGDSYWWDYSIPGDHDGQLFQSQAYVATMDGQLHIFNIGNLDTYTTNPKSTPTQVATVSVGNNPTSIAYGGQALDGKPNNLYVVSRGDRAVTRVQSNGNVVSTLRDSRMIDPVAAEISTNNRGCGEFVALSVMDYNGKQAINYVVHWEDDGAKTQGPNDYLFGYSTATPGKPFAFSVDEVN